MLPPYNFYWFRIDNKHMTEPWLNQGLMDSAYRSDTWLVTYKHIFYLFLVQRILTSNATKAKISTVVNVCINTLVYLSLFFIIFLKLQCTSKQEEVVNWQFLLVSIFICIHYPCCWKIGRNHNLNRNSSLLY